jgi:hypothetical protein
MSNERERAARRRETWSGGVAASFQELEEVDLKQALELSPRERLGLVWSLVEDSLAFGGNHGPTPRLQRSVGGVRPLRG